MLSDIIAQLAPTGVLYAGINLSNPLLVTGLSETGTPVGVSPDMVAALAARLDLPFEYKCYERAGDTADAVGECGVVLVAAEPQRAHTIAFSPAYAEIEATYLVPKDSPLQTIAHVDRNRCEPPTGLPIIYRDASATRCGIQNSLMAGITSGMSW